MRHELRLEHQPLELWVDQSLSLKDPLALINASVAVARQAEPKVLPNVLDALKRIDYESLDTAGRRELARAYELSFIRLGMPDDVSAWQLSNTIFRSFLPVMTVLIENLLRFLYT